MINFKKYQHIFKFFWPIALTMLLTNTLAFVDSAMIANYNILGVGAITAASQVQFLFGPVYFGVFIGVGIYTVQYYADQKYEKLKHLAGIALTVVMFLAVINFCLYFFFSDTIVNVMAPDNENIKLLTEQYIVFYKYSLLLVPINMFFISQFRSIKRPKISLYIGVLQSLLNILLNYLFIYGISIFPEMGIAGAAVATLISRFVTVVIYIVYGYKIKIPFLGSFKEMFSYDLEFFKEVIKTTIPLMIVEFGFGLGNVIYLKIYASLGADSYTAYNVAKNISFIINAFVIATTNVSGIMAGEIIVREQGRVKEVRESMKDIFKFIGFNSFMIIIATIFILPFFIRFFTDDPTYTTMIREILVINGIWMALRVFSSSLLAILKSGNDNKIVIVIDASTTYLIGIPLTLIVLVLFSPSIVVLRAVILIEFIGKIIFATYRYRQNKWIKKL